LTIDADVKEPANAPRRSVLKSLGPGLITGASDDDPAGIATYSQAGAQFGFSIGWTMLITFPLMASIQEIAGRIGRTTGHGISGNLCRHYPDWLLYSIVGLLFIANAINIGADLSAMGEAVRMLIGGPAVVYVVGFGVASVMAIVFLDYAIYVRVLKWLTLTLFAYVAALFASQVPWGEAAMGIFVPTVTWEPAFFTALVAIFGTTISPYLFFWQAAEEAEDERISPTRKPLIEAPEQAPHAFERIRADTLVGMGFSNLIAIAIIITAAATLHANGVTHVESAAQAAEALKPIAGDFAFAIFALGIIGTGLLAVPVLAGSAAYAIGEGAKWPVGLDRKPNHAKAFYGTLAGATLLGIGITLTPVNPMDALYWSAVINGVIAVPVMVVMMLMTARKTIMGEFTVRGPLKWLGWTATGAMALCVLGMALAWVI
jgi:NRAMP (natural resistance-associated macrophage protein)-like metal ion transporter